MMNRKPVRPLFRPLFRPLVGPLVGPLCAACVLLLSASSGSRADVSLPALIADNMVLQRGVPLPLGGSADPGEAITLSVAGQTAQVVAGPEGRWVVHLPPLTAGGPFTLTVTGKNVVTVKNVLVGEVWVCSGQSNMGYPLAIASTGPAAVAASANPQLRLFQVPLNFSNVPLSDTKSAWRTAGPTTTGGFSAVGYFFGRDLQKALGVPVGLIESDVGGTPGQLWTPQATLAAEPILKQTYLGGYETAFEQFTKATADWQVASKAARESGKPIPYKPDPPPHPASLYNGMIAPLTRSAIRGVIWYQGESNTDNPPAYRRLLPALIQSWRTAWEEPLLPFLIVQIAPWRDEFDPGVSRAELRQAQWETVLTTPRTGLAVTTDVGDEKDLHPRDKETVGARLSLLALNIAYGQKIVAQGPTLRQVTRHGNTVLLRFDNVGSGLVARGGMSSGTPVPDGVPVGFTLAGPDGKPQAAAARIISRDTVAVSSPEVTEPQTVAYGFVNYPVVNLWNKNGLPAVPFRTAVKPYSPGGKALTEGQFQGVSVTSTQVIPAVSGTGYAPRSRAMDFFKWYVPIPAGRAGCSTRSRPCGVKAVRGERPARTV